MIGETVTVVTKQRSVSWRSCHKFQCSRAPLTEICGPCQNGSCFTLVGTGKQSFSSLTAWADLILKSTREKMPNPCEARDIDETRSIAEASARAAYLAGTTEWSDMGGGRLSRSVVRTTNH